MIDTGHSQEFALTERAPVNAPVPGRSQELALTRGHQHCPPPYHCPCRWSKQITGLTELLCTKRQGLQTACAREATHSNSRQRIQSTRLTERLLSSRPLPFRSKKPWRRAATEFGWPFMTHTYSDRCLNDASTSSIKLAWRTRWYKPTWQ